MRRFATGDGDMSTLERIWRCVYEGAVNAGSLEPEDAAQDVMLRCLESDRRPLERAFPYAYWRVAGRNRARQQWERHRRSVPLTEMESSPSELEEAVLNRLALLSLPAWAMRRALRETQIAEPSRRRRKATVCLLKTMQKCAAIGA